MINPFEQNYFYNLSSIRFQARGIQKERDFQRLFLVIRYTSFYHIDVFSRHKDMIVQPFSRENQGQLQHSK